MDRPVRILKFGGTSVGTADVLRCAADIVDEATEVCRPVVVVSAADGVTDTLVEAANEAPHSSSEAAQWAFRVGDRYRTLAGQILADPSHRATYQSVSRELLGALEEALTEAIPIPSPRRDAVLATGERLMAPLVAAVLAEAGCEARAVDAATFLRTDASHGAAGVEWPVSRAQIRNWYADRSGDSVPVVTGFIGSTESGTTTTLGRGGSDYTAALLAHALEADCLERWTDVESLYTADPAENDDAEPLSRLGMDEARRAMQNGGLGLHPRTLDPLAAAGIPLHIRCTHRPEAPGTRVVPEPADASRSGAE